jgi:hypothetical protein
MGNLVYFTNGSLDLLIEDERGLTAESAGTWAAASRGTSR